MDIEADKRREVIGAINHFFDVWEEVSLSGADGNLRIDLVAVPRDRSKIDAAIGFEVKSPSRAPNFQNWAKAFKQAADYVGARIVDDRVPQKILTGVFVYPSPPYIPCASPMPIMFNAARFWSSRPPVAWHSPARLNRKYRCWGMPGRSWNTILKLILRPA